MAVLIGYSVAIIAAVIKRMSPAAESDNNSKNNDNIANQKNTRNGSITIYSIVKSTIAKNFSNPGYFERLYWRKFNARISLLARNL